MLVSGDVFFWCERLRLSVAARTLLEQQPAQGPEVVQDPAASIHMHFQLFQVVDGESQGIHSTRDVRFGFPVQIAFDLSLGIVDSFG